MTRPPVMPSQPLLKGGTYVPSHQTDIRQRFEAIRQAQQAEAEAAAAARTPNVQPLKRRKP